MSKIQHVGVDEVSMAPAKKLRIDTAEGMASTGIVFSEHPSKAFFAAEYVANAIKEGKNYVTMRAIEKYADDNFEPKER
jgi:ApbE superfamily uncharacterized protein (UPF0280 family)